MKVSGPAKDRRTRITMAAQKAAMVITSPIRTRPDGAVAPSETAVKTETMSTPNRVTPQMTLMIRLSAIMRSSSMPSLR